MSSTRSATAGLDARRNDSVLPAQSWNSSHTSDGLRTVCRAGAMLRAHARGRGSPPARWMPASARAPRGPSWFRPLPDSLSELAGRILKHCTAVHLEVFLGDPV